MDKTSPNSNNMNLLLNELRDAKFLCVGHSSRVDRLVAISKVLEKEPDFLREAILASSTAAMTAINEAQANVAIKEFYSQMVALDKRLGHEATVECSLQVLDNIKQLDESGSSNLVSSAEMRRAANNCLSNTLFKALHSTSSRNAIDEDNAKRAPELYLKVNIADICQQADRGYFSDMEYSINRAVYLISLVVDLNREEAVSTVEFIERFVDKQRSRGRDVEVAVRWDKLIQNLSNVKISCGIVTKESVSGAAKKDKKAHPFP